MVLRLLVAVFRKATEAMSPPRREASVGVIWSAPEHAKEDIDLPAATRSSSRDQLYHNNLSLNGLYVVPLFTEPEGLSINGTDIAESAVVVQAFTSDKFTSRW